MEASKQPKKDNLFRKFMRLDPIIRILIGIIIAIPLGVFLPNLGFIRIFGSMFVGALKAMAPILVFVLVMNALSKAGEGIGSRFKTVIFFYMITTFIAAFVAVFASYLFPVTMSLKGIEAAGDAAPSTFAEVMKAFFVGIVSNPVAAIAEGNYISILFWAVLAGLIMKKIAKPATIDFCDDLAAICSRIIHIIVQFAPIGILGLVYESIADNGIGIFVDYGKLILLLVGAMLFSSLIINPIIASITIGKNAYPLVFKCIKESGLTAFFTRSSAANIPVNMELCERMGLDPELYSVSIPLGSTINMDGAASVITVLSLMGARMVGIEVSIPTALVLSIISTLAACGTSGVGGGSLLLVPMACSMLGVPADVAAKVMGIGFSINFIQDSVETCLNSSGDAIFTACAEFREWRKQGKEIKW